MTYIIIIGAIIFALVFYMTNREKSNKKKVDAEEEARKQSAAAELWDKAHEQQEKDWKEEREKQYQQEREKMNQKSELEKKISNIPHSDYKEIEAISLEINELVNSIDEKTMRWMEPSEKIG